jgi:hypothetical protein
VKYESIDREICVGDSVLVEGGIMGTVVCDFERWLCLNGYEDWLTKEKMVGGNYLSSGILVKTDDMGMIHYAEPDETIVFNG